MTPGLTHAETPQNANVNLLQMAAQTLHMQQQQSRQVPEVFAQPNQVNRATETFEKIKLLQKRSQPDNFNREKILLTLLTNLKK